MVTLSNLRQISQHALCFLQASDILTAAAPINLKKQDLLDLESGVSTTLFMSFSALSLGTCVLLCNAATWEPVMHAQCMPARFEPVLHLNISLCTFSCLQAQAKLMVLPHGATLHPLNGPDQLQCWCCYIAWPSSCCSTFSGNCPAETHCPLKLICKVRTS